jgi:restriction endonuclease S subunit
VNTLEPKEDLLNPANSTSNWDYRKLSDLVKITMGQSPNSRFYNSIGFGIPLIQGNADVKKRNAIIRTYTSLVTKVANPGDILLSVRAPVGEVSKTSFKCCIGRGVCALSSGSDFLYYYLELIEPSWSRISSGTTFESVNSSQVRELLVPAPPLEEQKAIAQVLSDFDNLIDGLERLIAKKRSIKEGVMQELLRPKEGWVVRKLNDVARLYNGYAFKSADYVAVGDYKIITIANVQEGHMTYTGTSRLEKLPFDIQAHQKLELGEILVSMTGNVGRVCQVNIENALLNQRVGKIVGYGISPSFLFSVLNTKDFQNKMIELAQGGAQGNIGKWDILNFEFCAPSDLSEQDKIAQTIGDFDEELSLLEGKLSKYNQIKQGVMNELLTGKTRLV